MFKQIFGICLLFGGLIECKVKRAYDWKDAEEMAENAVAQIVAQHSEFNWREPFKASKQLESTGSAFFINKEGYLMTNYHCVDHARSLQVYIPALGQKPADADIVGVCPEIDVAIIKLRDAGIKAIKQTLKQVPFLTLGDSDMLFPTEPVLALGYPLGQRYLKSTVGVVAGREYIDGRSYTHITAPINPGNSGGPLLNLDGQVVGINTANIAHSQSIGYIVPIYDAKILLKDLHTQKLVRKPSLGIYCNPTTDEHATLLKNPLPAGAYIYNVEARSIAASAGVKSGDMIYAINGHPVDSYGDVTVNWKSSVKVSLEEFLIRLPSKTKLTLEVYRNGQKQLLQCIYEAPQLHPVRHIYPDYEPEAVEYEIIGGMCIMQLRLNHLDLFERIVPLHQYRLSANQNKEVLIITRLLPGSVVHRVNCFYEGALLDELNGKKVKNLKEVRKAMRESASTGIISFKTKEKISTAVSVESILNEESRLNRDFKFESTPAIKELKKLRVKKTV